LNRFGAIDLTVVIPTRDRPEILARTLDHLRAQTVSGFSIVVVVDGTDQPSLVVGGVRVIVTEHEGPGSARNAGARAASTPLVLFLGDDMLPVSGLIAAHLDGHSHEPGPEVGVLGSVAWHPDAGGSRINRWLDWSASQFDMARLVPHADAHWTRFYSCNVSLKRDWFLDAGGFDPDFTYYYEDLDCGWRLREQGLRLRFEPAARAEHLHRYDWSSVIRRFDGIAAGEHLMAVKHPDFEPFFRRRAEEALRAPTVPAVWARAVDHVPARSRQLRDHARRRANTWYYQQLGPRYLDRFAAAEDLADLRAYLGDTYDEAKLHGHLTLVEAEERAAPDERTFYRTSDAYLYDLTVFAMSGTKVPYRETLGRLVPPGTRLLDYGCGIGTDGLRLLQRGYRVEFADFDNPSTRYLRWRLARRSMEAPVHDLDAAVPGGFDLVYAFDVIEHVEDPFAFLAELEDRGALVLVNLLEPEPHERHPHRPLPIGPLLDHAAEQGILHYSVHHGRSHLVAYRSTSADAFDRLRSRTLRRVGPRLSRLAPLADAAGITLPLRRARRVVGRLVRSTR
jgi:GT2 family glycosyltransferase/2-polyprenyl-3-methyl-5-hydroxy-6-metoxy-1,4-benzoquinol methylase